MRLFSANLGGGSSSVSVTANRVVLSDSGGGLTTDSGITYDSTLHNIAFTGSAATGQNGLAFGNCTISNDSAIANRIGIALGTSAGDGRLVLRRNGGNIAVQFQYFSGGTSLTQFLDATSGHYLAIDTNSTTIQTIQATEQLNIQTNVNVSAVTAMTISTGGVVTLGTGTSATHRFNTSTTAAGTDAMTLLNGPANTAGNPDTFLNISINGTVHVIPAWNPA